MLTIRPYDPGSLSDISRAILKSELGLTPSSDGRIIRLPIPSLTEERRHDLARQVRQRVEDAKVALRNIRREALEDLRQFEEEKLLSEDEFFRGKEELQRLTDRYSEKLDEIGVRKQREILEG